MIYIPAQHQSRRSQELADELRGSIASYQARNPKVNSDEIRQALAAVTPGGRMPRAKAIAISAAIIFAVGVLGTVMSTLEGVKRGRPVPVVPIVVLGSAGLALVAILFARARDND
ncbi:MAG: hypothetical protein ACT4P7_16455 [Gemmatimonadaceae bacterium]